MAFGDKTDETPVVDHDAEAAEQAAIAAEVEPEAPAEEEAPVAEQPPTAAETAENDPLAAPPEATVTVEAANPELSSAAVAGYEVVFAEGETYDVPAFVAEELAAGENVEVVA
jgi:hypothetical protein